MQGARVVDSAILDSDDDDSYGCARLAPLQGHSSSSASQRESSAESAQHRWKCCCVASSRCLFSFILLCEASHCVHIWENRNGTKIKRQKKKNRTGSLLQWKSSLFYLSQCFRSSCCKRIPDIRLHFQFSSNQYFQETLVTAWGSNGIQMTMNHTEYFCGCTYEFTSQPVQSITFTPQKLFP